MSTYPCMNSKAEKFAGVCCTLSTLVDLYIYKRRGDTYTVICIYIIYNIHIYILLYMYTMVNIPAHSRRRPSGRTI